MEDADRKTEEMQENLSVKFPDSKGDGHEPVPNYKDSRRSQKIAAEITRRTPRKLLRPLPGSYSALLESPAFSRERESGLRRQKQGTVKSHADRKMLREHRENAVFGVSVPCTRKWALRYSPSQKQYFSESGSSIFLPHGNIQGHLQNPAEKRYSQHV